MKITYTLLLSAFAISGFGQVASCTLDPVFVSSNKEGIWPDSVTNFVSGTENTPYLQNLTIKVPKDTVTGFGTFCFNRIEVSSPTGITNFNLPPGLSMVAGPNVTLSGTTYKFPGNANTCAEISGTPAAPGTYTLQFKVQPYVTPSGGSCSSSPNVAGGSALTAPTTLVYYKIVVNPVAGVKEELTSTSFALSNVPNPATGKTSVHFFVKDEAPVKITVYNLLGAKIFEDKFKSVYGDNNYEINCSDWNSGVYLYSVHYKNHSETRRMVINPAR